MRATTAIRTAWIVAAIAMCMGSVFAPNETAEETSRINAGRNLEARYSKRIDDLKATILKSVPKVNGRKKAAYLKARETEKAAVA